MCSATMFIFGKRKTEIDCWAMPAITHLTRRSPSHSVSLVYLIADSPITFTAECKWPINPAHLMLIFCAVPYWAPSWEIPGQSCKPRLDDGQIWIIPLVVSLLTRVASFFFANSGSKWNNPNGKNGRIGADRCALRDQMVWTTLTGDDS